MKFRSPTFYLWRVFALEPDRLTALERTLLRVALLIGLFVVAWTFKDVRTDAGVDLRNRVVGARVMLAGHDPYTFVWQPGMDETLLDPVYDPKAHRLTLSPPTLLLYAVIAPAPYAFQRLASYAAEWLALIVSLALLARCIVEPRQRVVFLLGATLFVIATDIWRLHVERGQVYVFHLLALSAAIYFSRRGQVDSLAAGAALGILGLMRPNLLLFGAALVLLRQWRAAGAFTTTVAVGLIAAFLMLPTSSWRSYLDVGDQYFQAIQDPAAVPDRPRPKADGWAEGVNFDDPLTNVESSSVAVLWKTLHDQIDLPMLDLARTSKVMLLVFAAALIAALWFGRGKDARAGLALTVVIGLDTEFFLPHRWGYADVMLLAPLAVMLPALLRARSASLVALGVVTLGLVSGPMGQQFLGLYASTVLRSWLVMGGLTLLAGLEWGQLSKESADIDAPVEAACENDTGRV